MWRVTGQRLTQWAFMPIVPLPAYVPQMYGFDRLCKKRCSPNLVQESGSFHTIPKLGKSLVVAPFKMGWPWNFRFPALGCLH